MSPPPLSQLIVFMESVETNQKLLQTYRNNNLVVRVFHTPVETPGVWKTLHKVFDKYLISLGQSIYFFKNFLNFPFFQIKHCFDCHFQHYRLIFSQRVEEKLDGVVPGFNRPSTD